MACVACAMLTDRERAWSICPPHGEVDTTSSAAARVEGEPWLLYPLGEVLSALGQPGARPRCPELLQWVWEKWLCPQACRHYQCAWCSCRNLRLKTGAKVPLAK